jgi:hypothetical protein
VSPAVPALLIVVASSQQEEASVEQDDEEDTMNRDLGGWGQDWLSRLVEEMGRAAQAGSAQTVRFIAQLVVAAAAIALILEISK